MCVYLLSYADVYLYDAYSSICTLCTYVYNHTYIMYIYIDIYTHCVVCAHTYVHVHTSVPIVYICTYTHIYTYIYIHMVSHMICAMARRWGLHGEGQFLGLGGAHRHGFCRGSSRWFLWCKTDMESTKVGSWQWGDGWTVLPMTRSVGKVQKSWTPNLGGFPHWPHWHQRSSQVHQVLASKANENHPQFGDFHKWTWPKSWMVYKGKAC